jgi:hypothetical protein
LLDRDRRTRRTETDVPSTFEITLERTMCLGECPVYRVSIDGEGRVLWRGAMHVAAVGIRRATIPKQRVAEIARKLHEVKFFELDERGALPDPSPVCTHEPNSVKSCSFSFSEVTICSDTSAAVITVRQATQMHVVRNDHCEERPLVSLEALVDDVARTSAWIGERITH